VTIWRKSGLFDQNNLTLNNLMVRVKLYSVAIFGGKNASTTLSHSFTTNLR